MNEAASFGPDWPLVTVDPTPLENTTYRIPFQIPENQAAGNTTFYMTNFQGARCSSVGGVGPTIGLTIVEPATVSGAPTDLGGSLPTASSSWTGPHRSTTVARP